MRLAKDDISPYTWDAYQRYQKYFLPFFGEMDVREIRKYHISDFRQSLPANYKAKTIKNILGVLHAFFTWVEDEEKIAKIPKFPKIEVPEPDWAWAEEETQKKILAKIPWGDRPIFIFMRRTACRQGEARVMQVADFEWGKGIVTIKRSISKDRIKPTKTSKIRKFPIHPDFEAWIKPLCGGNKLPSAFVFTKNGRPYAPTTLRKIWDTACRRAEVKGIHLMAGTRHSLASQLAMDQTSIQWIQKLLGHSTSRTTERYAHLSELEAKRIMMGMGEVKQIKEDKND